MAQETVHTIYSGLSDPATHAPGTLFESWDIWIAMRVPQRSLYIQKVQQNGGRIVQLERNAHIMIADHLRRDAPPGTISYRWIDQCMADATIVDGTRFLAGPPIASQQIRPVGASAPAAGGRVPFTAEDDRVLYEWVTNSQSRGASILGNEIYKQLQRHNPRHPWQSWRDRWVKYVSHKPPVTTVSQETPPTPPSDHDRNEPESMAPPARPAPQSQPESEPNRDKQRRATSNQPQPVQDKTRFKAPAPPAAPVQSNPTSLQVPLQSHPPKPPSTSRRRSSPLGQNQQQQMPETSARIAQLSSAFNRADHRYLLENASDIENVPVGKYDSVWDDFHEAMPEHSANEWREYYELVVLPAWKEGRVNVDKPRFKPPSPFTARVSASTVDLPQGSSDTTSQKRKRAVNSDVTESEPQHSSKRLRGDSPLDNVMSGLVGESPSEQARKASQSRRVDKNRAIAEVEVVELESDDNDEMTSRSRPHQPTEKPEFGVYEDTDMPEEEKENMVVDDSGSFSIPPRHVHVRSDEALDAFSDPLPKFILQNNGSRYEAEAEAEADLEANVDAAMEHGAVGVGSQSDDREAIALLEVLETKRIPPTERDRGHIFDGQATTLPHHDAQEILDAQARFMESVVPVPLDKDVVAAPEATVSQVSTTSQGLFITDSSQSMVEEVERDIDEEEDDDDYEEMTAPQPNATNLIDTELQAYLDVPLPPISDDEEEPAREPEETTNSQSRKPAAVETQDILDAETQYPDLSVPPPPTSQDMPSSPPGIPPSHPTISRITVREEIRNNPAPRSPSPLSSTAQHRPPRQPQAGPPSTSAKLLDNPDFLDRFVERQKAFGHSPTDVAYAIQRTSCCLDATLDVLALMQRREPLPTDVKGIWTPEHDDIVRGGTAREMERLQRLHGKEAFDERVVLLHSWESGQDDDDDDDDD